MDINNLTIDFTKGATTIEKQLSQQDAINYSQCAMKGYDYYLRAIYDLNEAGFIPDDDRDKMVEKLSAEVNQYLVKFNSPGRGHHTTF